MPEDARELFSDAERAELDRVVEALVASPRLSHLLRYMGAKLFAGEVDQLTEYNIATEVFGRSRTAFNTVDDAIARVETHRLRKSLATFYETEGKNHPVQVTLPARSYVPVFIHRPGGARSPFLSDTPEPDFRGESYRLSRWVARRWRYLLLAAALISVALGAYLHVRAPASSRRAKPDTGPAPAPASAPVQSAVSSLPIRLLAGYSGPPRTDGAGQVWNPDQYFSGGGNWQRAPGFLARASDPFLFEYSRTGDFSYRIPLQPGSYELHLFFSTPVRVSEGSYSFTVWINDESVLVGFDINVDALGENVADERVFRGVSPGKDGFLRIGFSAVTGPATLNALEILPGLPHRQLPIRLIMQSTPFTDHKGHFWRPDNYFLNGRLSAQTRPLADSPEPDLFSGERYGHFTYAIPADTRDRYTLVLHFAELYFGSGAPGNGGVGSRIFRVMCNGAILLDDFDILKEAGTLHEVSKTFRHLKPSAQGKLDLTFEPIVNNATVSGIEVLDESE